MKNMNKKKIGGIVLVFALMLTMSAVMVEAPSTTEMKVEPSSQDVAIGDYFYVSVKIYPSEGICSAKINELTFTTSKVDAIAVTRGIPHIFGSTPDWWDDGTINEGGGNITGIQSGDGDYVGTGNGQTNSGTFCYIQFKATAEGTADIKLTDVEVANETVVQLTVNVFNATATVKNMPPVFSNENPTNGDTGVAIGLSSWSVKIEDPEADNFDWSIDTSPDVGNNSANGDTNGTKSASLSSLEYFTLYTVYVNATDAGSSEWTNETYTFKTEAEVNIQIISIDGQGNGSTIDDTTPIFNWTLMEDAICYRLQVDDNVGWGSPEVNLMDINETNYPSHCFYKGDYVEFTLPNEYALEADNHYYFRVVEGEL